MRVRSGRTISENNGTENNKVKFDPTASSRPLLLQPHAQMLVCRCSCMSANVCLFVSTRVYVYLCGDVAST